jgi:hypothetical protein
MLISEKSPELRDYFTVAIGHRRGHGKELETFRQTRKRRFDIGATRNFRDTSADLLAFFRQEEVHQQARRVGVWRIYGHTEGVKTDDHRFQGDPIDGRALRFYLFNVAAEAVDVKWKLAGEKQWVGSGRCAGSNLLSKPAHGGAFSLPMISSKLPNMMYSFVHAHLPFHLGKEDHRSFSAWSRATSLGLKATTRVSA